MSDSITILTQAEANQLMTNYANYVTPRLPTNDDINGLFKMPDPHDLSDPIEPNEYLGGWTIPFPDFFLLGSFPGATKCIFSFGQDSTSYPHLKMLLQLQDDKGIIRSPIFQLNKTCKALEPFVRDREHSTGGPNSVADMLAAQWCMNWWYLIQQPPVHIPAKFCSIKIYEGSEMIVPLKKYTLPLSDIMSSLHIGTQSAEDCHLRVYLVNHKYHGGTTSIPDDTVNDSIGIMCCMMGPYSNGLGSGYEAISSFYDFSAPCPPTCPQ